MTFRSSARLRVRTGSGATRLLPARSPTASSSLGSPNTTVARTEASVTTASAPVTVTTNQGGALIRRPKVEFLHVAVQIGLPRERLQPFPPRRTKEPSVKAGEDEFPGKAFTDQQC